MKQLSPRKLKLLTAFLCIQNIFLMATNLWVMEQRKHIGRRWWVDPVLKDRHAKGVFTTVFLKYKRLQHERFFKLTGLTVPQFNELLDIVKHKLQKASYREPLNPEFRLAFTICYLASGNSIVRMADSWKIGKTTAYEVVKETCEAIWNVLKSTHLTPPSEKDWKDIAEGFWKRWNMPHCCGSLDGKHIRIQCPVNSGSQFFNYKQFFTIVLMAMCDSNYCFTWMEVGDYGSLPDGKVFGATGLGTALAERRMNFPEPDNLPGTDVKFPYFIVGDEAFPLQENLMRPYYRRSLRGEAQRIFNYRLSRARLTIENAFGVLSSSWWRALRTTMGQFPENVERVVLATCLHNFIMKREEHIEGFKQYCPPTYVDHENEDGVLEPGGWRAEAHGNFQDIGRCGGNRGASDATSNRDLLAQYFLSATGFVEWQWRSAYRGFEANLP